VKIYYFAFGSNLSSPRLLERLPAASVHCVATLPQHQLCWRKNDRSQSGKCDIEFTRSMDDIVYGVVYLMTQADKLELDVYETTGFGYAHKEVTVTTVEDETIGAFTYFALDIDHSQQPFHWYKEHVLRGALEHDFPEHYVAHIKATPSIDDHDRERHHRELSIYRNQI
jgi:hypothetical protein